MGYCTYITRAGYELQAKLFAEGGDFHITRVEVGRGVCPPEADPALLTGLVERMAVATSTTPRRVGCEVSLEVEYRSDLNGALETAFQINEFGVFTVGVDGTEILLLYGDLSDYPETAVPQKYGGCVRRYPVNVTIGPDAEASLGYPAAAWMTHEEVHDAIQEGLDKGLALEGGGTVGEAVTGMRDELAQVQDALKGEDGKPLGETVGGLKEELAELKESLTGEDGSSIQDTVGGLADQVAAVKRAVGASAFHKVFEPSDWTGNTLRIPKTEHGMEPVAEPVLSTLRMRLGRTAAEFDAETAAPVAGLLLTAVKAALAANAVPDPEPETPTDPEAPTDPDTPPEGEPEQQAGGEDTGEGTGSGDSGGEPVPEPAPVVPPVRYPVAEDGHVILTWEQVQYLLLESTSFEEEGTIVWNPALVPAEEAEAQAVPLGYAFWRERDNGVEPTATLDELLTAAYLPALGGPSASFEAMVTLQALQGLRLRRGAGGEGHIAKYDLDGWFSKTWGTMASRVVWDLGTGDLVVSAAGAFAGDILVTGRGVAGEG